MAEPDSDAPPRPPAGYGEPYRFTFPRPGLTASSLVVFVFLIPLLGQLTWRLQGQPAVVTFSLPPGWQGIVFVVLPLLLLPGIVAVHELIHGLTYRLLGYRVAYGFYWKFGAYAAAFGQFQKRSHAMIVALTPLLLLSLSMIPLLAAPSGIIVTLAFLVVVINTTGAVADIYLAWKLSRLPRRTLAYDADIHHMWIYEPERMGSGQGGGDRLTH